MGFKEQLQSNKLVLVDFWATWCGPCQTQAPILHSLKEKAGDTVKILKIDVDKNQTIAQQLNIASIPTLILFKEGEIIWRQAEVASLQQLEQLIKMHL